MRAARTPLIIPAETQNRELDAKILLSCFAAERGFPVIVGSKKAINLQIDALPRSIFLSKSLTDRNVRLYRILVNLGHRIVCGDEEGLIWFSPDHYLATKVGDNAIGFAEALLAWGPHNAENWERAPAYTGAPIHITGNARVDLLRPELRGFFADEVRQLRERYGRFILINTNFSRLNHYLPGQSRQLQLLEDADNGDRSAPEFDVGLARHRLALFEQFRVMVGQVCRAHPNHAVVVRPHPSESHDVWRRAGEGCSNLHVVHEGNAVPWLLACDAMIHNGCTTGVETHLLGRTSIAYQPVTSERFDLHLSNGLSVQAFDLDSLESRITLAVAGKLKPSDDAAVAQRKLLARHIAAVDGRFACERIIDVLVEFDDATAGDPAPGFGARARGRLGTAFRRARKRVENRIPGHRNDLRYLKHKFPGIGVDEVRARIQQFGELLGRFDRIEVRPLFDNVFEITGEK